MSGWQGSIQERRRTGGSGSKEEDREVTVEDICCAAARVPGHVYAARVGVHWLSLT